MKTELGRSMMDDALLVTRYPLLLFAFVLLGGHATSAAADLVLVENGTPQLEPSGLPGRPGGGLQLIAPVDLGPRRGQDLGGLGVGVLDLSGGLATDVG